MNSQEKFINLLNPIYIENEVKRKKIQIIIFFSITFGLTYLLGLLLYFMKFIKPENFASFMMILPLSSVAIAKFYTEGKTNDKYKFYSLIILFFLAYFLLFIIESLNLINNDKLEIMNLILTFLSSLCVIIYSFKSKDLYLLKNFKISALLIIYFIFSQIIFGLMISKNQLNYNGILYYMLTPLTSLISIYHFLCEEYGWRYYLQNLFFDKFSKKTGVIMVGICWSLWHLPLQFTLYSPEAPIIGSTVHLIYGIGLSIFLGYVYMKTKNIWVCSIIHVLVNSLSLIVLDSDAETISSYYNIVERLIFISLFYIPFLLTKEYKQNI
ncbi:MULTISPECIES: type II CAAX endopeptidase family protein [unclassified Clostridioides]|uniref:CPBP family intramembrane glutamic endopeptidase n=2 Tax=Clostridioides TaxID=1870884 RepID=UPI001D12F904|nr:CPBP family intramembrane metalloprotease [Clostridioides sp. ZZV14-6105]MCC0727359.1 CPBP family intramembrane metalloprotease [Clostridioides sp. ZZV14-6045]MCC0729534.1 CPBP family intramembrane metalloprotease [Clostridioides sp. ZZV14-6048]MCC0733716.1 CPBP family intramembrane metalloprotease [Clostridioides sp. ZZV14-6009]